MSRTARLLPQPRARPLLARLPVRTFATTFPRHQHDLPSVSSTEISHFNALASSWWDPHGPSRVLYLMNPLRHDFIRSCLASTPQAPTGNGLHYLDVGCGGGIFAESAARLLDTASVTGIDPSEEVLKVARAHARRDPTLAGAADDGRTDARLRYLSTTIEGLSSNSAHRSEGYDVLSLFEVLEHVPSPSDFLTHCASHIKPGGWLILSTIARTWTSWLVTKVAAEDLLRMVPRGTHDWWKYLNEAEVREWFDQGERRGKWELPRAMGVMYVPGLGWKEVRGGEEWGNYFFGIRKRPLDQSR